MDKKILAMLLALAMIISVVPMTAMAEEHECTFDVVVSNNNGTHTRKCNVEGCTGFTMNCGDSDGNGKCDACGYQMYVAPEEDHEHNYVLHSNNDGTHTSSCNCGNEVTINCLDNNGDGKCDACGYQKYVAPEKDHEHNYVPHSNNDGTHTSSCNCGNEVRIDCLDNDGDDFCDSCGYLLYPDICDHESHGVVDNKDGLSHNVVCRDCTKTLEVKVAHTYVNGVCACGAIDTTPDVLPEEVPTQQPSTAGLDYVPKTGSCFIEWLYALIFG